MSVCSRTRTEMLAHLRALWILKTKNRKGDSETWTRQLSKYYGSVSGKEASRGSITQSHIKHTLSNKDKHIVAPQTTTLLQQKRFPERSRRRLSAIHECVHICAYAHTLQYLMPGACMCMRACARVCECLNASARVYETSQGRLKSDLHVCTCVRLCMHLCACACVHTHPATSKTL